LLRFEAEIRGRTIVRDNATARCFDGVESHVQDLRIAVIRSEAD
jgi:hypothetical protein